MVSPVDMVPSGRYIPGLLEFYLLSTAIKTYAFNYTEGADGEDTCETGQMTAY